MLEAAEATAGGQGEAQKGLAMECTLEDVGDTWL